MAIRILTKNGIENTNIDGARDNNFNAGRRSGIVKGALNEGNVYGTSNTLTLEPCELRICGHRIVIDENENRTFTNRPQTATKQSLIAQIQVDGENVAFELIVQNSSTALVQDNLDINGSGTYQLEIGTFIQNTDGTISDVVRTADLISGSYNIDLLASKDLSNVTYPQFIADGNVKSGASDRVIESYISSDGNSWYIKWASGRKECGGRFSTGESKTPTNVAYGVTFSAEPLVLQTYPRQSINNSSVVAVKIITGSISNTGFKAVGCYAGDTTGYASVLAGFYACGY